MNNVEIQQDDELSENESPSLSGPTGYFQVQVYFQTMSIFRHGDHIPEIAGCYLWMVGQVGKIDEILFLEYWANSSYRSSI